jgi:phosphoesterase RecJ-like protein
MTDITEQITKLKEFLEKANKVLITSHISPDPDAICSALLLGTTIEENYPNKQVLINFEESPEDLEFLPHYQKIKYAPLIEAVETQDTDLFIIVDTNTYDRVSRFDGEKLRQLLKSKKNQIKTAILDHHQPEGKDDSDIYVNLGGIAAVQDIYEVLFDTLNFRKPDGYVTTTLTGIYSDSGGFSYPSDKYKETFRIVTELIKNGGNLEAVKRNLANYSEEEMEVIGELIKNLSSYKDFTYSFIDDNYVKAWTTENKSIPALIAGCKVFIDQFIRNIDGRVSGFVVYPNVIAGDGEYAVSFRSIGGALNVADLARKLGGGGHIPAAGAKFKAASVEAAIDKVKSAIEESSQS